MKKLLGMLGWIGVALVVAAVGLRFFARPAWSGWAPQWSQYLALAGLAVTLVYSLSQWRDIGRSFQGRGARYGSLAAGSLVVFVAILVGLNWIANRQNKRWDLSSGGQFELSDQTRQILRSLDKPVQVQVFYDSRGGGSADPYRDKLDEYAYYSRHLAAEYIDAIREPLKADNAKIDTLPTIILSYEGRSERTTTTDEQSLTNALKKVIEGAAKKIYFIQGHGEHDITDSSSRGYSAVADALKTDNFEVASLTLAQVGRIPDDATVVVVGGPKTDYLAPEIEALRSYLQRGGKVLLAIDPADREGTAPPTGLIALARDWGVALGNDIVIDTSGMGQLVGANAATPIAMPADGFHPITRDFRLITAFPIARSATPIEGGANGKVAQKVLQTTPQSWAEADVKGLYATSKPTLDPTKGDLVGPISLAAAVSAPAPDAPEPASADLPKPEARLIVVGDSDFMTSGAMGIPGNKDLALNMANWLAQQENLIAIRAKSPESRPLTMTADQRRIVFWLTLIGVPLVLIGNGIRVWWRRR